MVKTSHNIVIKKQYGQHFLRDQAVLNVMLDAVAIDKNTSVFEIGCGDGFLTQAILQTPIARLWVFEIDPEWAGFVRNKFKDQRLTVYQENFLDLDMARLEPHAPWTVLANLPYNVTFPILHKFQESRHLLKEGVVMLQEEVAQKLVKKSGKGYGFISLYFQYFFELKLLTKIPPSAFYPAPKVFSRLIYFKPKTDLVEIPNEEQFWKFIKVCFRQPRRTLRNNLAQTHYDLSRFDDELLGKRAQQLAMGDFLKIWSQLSH
ncbi:MAG: 16S rRNA (adenine(1518)-N(6)/adenine(1519)-N(6))-dimethyltransferase RsmA [Candidatus Babeliales bacterium]